jgi:hypothetical protein
MCKWVRGPVWFHGFDRRHGTKKTDTRRTTRTSRTR